MGIPISPFFDTRGMHYEKIYFKTNFKIWAFSRILVIYKLLRPRHAFNRAIPAFPSGCLTRYSGSYPRACSPEIGRGNSATCMKEVIARSWTFDVNKWKSSVGMFPRHMACTSALKRPLHSMYSLMVVRSQTAIVLPFTRRLNRRFGLEYMCRRPRHSRALDDQYTLLRPYLLAINIHSFRAHKAFGFYFFF